MSILKGRILKGGSGKTGRLIQSSWKGIEYIRTMPDNVKNPRTPKQQSQRGRFKAVTELAKKVFHPLIREIWNPLSKRNMGFNKFTKTNIHTFNSDGSIKHYEDLIFSIGDIPFPDNIQIIKDRNIDSRIIVRWSYSPETEVNNADDILNIVVIEEISNSYNLIILNKIYSKREQRQVAIDLPFNNISGIHLYPYFSNSSGTSYSHNSYVKV